VTTAAVTRFEDVINYISNSKLNFSIYKTPFSAQISLKKSFAKYFGEIEDLAAAANNMDAIKKETVKPKLEPMECGEVSVIKEMEKLKSFIEDNLKEISELRSQNSELESKLKQANKESKKNRQRAEKYQKLVKIEKDVNQNE
jgi:chromosome segregation ATPase